MNFFEKILGRPCTVMNEITRLCSIILWGHQRGKTGFEDPRVSTAGLNPELPRMRRTQEGRTSRNVLGKMFVRLHRGQRGDPILVYPAATPDVFQAAVAIWESHSEGTSKRRRCRQMCLSRAAAWSASQCAISRPHQFPKSSISIT